MFNKKHYPIKLTLPIILWLSAILFFAFQFVLRLSAGILREEIIEKYQVTTNDFGTLAGYYYLGYAGMQVPLGIMLDKFSLRYVSFISIFTTFIGTLLFVTSNNWALVIFGRFIIGVGSTAGFLIVAKVIKSYFLEKHQQLMLSLSFTFGLIGATGGGIFLRVICNNFGYEATFYLLALICLSISIINFVVNTYISHSHQNIQNSTGISNTMRLLINPTILFIGICGGLMVGALEGFADVWIVPFFTDVYSLTQNQSIFLGSSIFLGMCIGAPLLTFISNKIRSINILIFITGTLTSLIFVLLFLSHSIPYYILIGLMLFLGVLCSYQVLVFSLVGTLVTPANVGVAIALTNCINMSFGHFFHKSIGYFIGYSGNTTYSMSDFILGLGIIPICCTVGQCGFLYLEYYFKKYNFSKL